MSELVLDLVPLPYEKIPGNYGKAGTTFARRLAFMHPACAAKFLELEEATGWNIVVTDMWRASLSSLARKYPAGKPARPGTQPPAYSAHNYGFAIDIDVEKTMKRLVIKKPELDAIMAEHGFYCHRRDGKLEREAWHYNCVVVGDVPTQWLRFAGKKSTAGAVEAMIEALYGRFWALTEVIDAQAMLQRIGMYHGEIDGIAGPLTREAIKAFQRAWKLVVDGKLGPRTNRTLAFRAAELSSPALASLWK